MRRGVIMLVTMLVMFTFTSACSVTERPESTALSFAKAVFEEQDIAKAKTMYCPETEGLWDMETAASSLGDNLVTTNFKVIRADKRQVTSADEANGITGRVKVRISFAYKSDKTSGQYKDEGVSIHMIRRHGRWCVGFF